MVSGMAGPRLHDVPRRATLARVTARNPRLRIAFARIAQETNALSLVRTTTDDFRASHFLEGTKLLSACGRFGYEAPGFLRNAELSGFVRAAREDGRR